MQSLDLNVASRPFRNNMLLWFGLVVAVGLLVAGTVWNVRSYTRHTLLLEDLKSKVDSIDRDHSALDARQGRAQREIRKVDLETLDTKAFKANEVIGWKAFSWTRLFNRMQQVLPHDVQMVSVRPVFRADRAQRVKSDDAQEMVPVSVEGVAKNFEAFLEFERALIEAEHFDHVNPEGFSRDENSNEIVFRLRFRYDPGLDQDTGAAPPPVEPPVPAEASGVDGLAALRAEDGDAPGEEPQ